MTRYCVGQARILKPLKHVGIAAFYGVCTDLPDMNILQECVIGTSVHDMCHGGPEGEGMHMTVELIR